MTLIPGYMRILFVVESLHFKDTKDLFEDVLINLHFSVDFCEHQHLSVKLIEGNVSTCNRKPDKYNLQQQIERNPY